jgi:outer membrane protein assembly factor BamD
VTGAARRLGVLALPLALVACPKELPQDAPPDELYSIGVEKYERRDWTRAIEAFQRFLYQDPGHQKADSAQYLIGESYLQQRQYLTAAAEFLRLAQNRPAGPLADDARYGACESYARLSPRPELDQEYTEEAIEQCRAVILLYPGSPYAEEAANRTRELTDKLARKYYLNAVYYYKRRAYDSAIVYLEYLVKTYRGASVEPEALYTLWDAYRKLGYVEEARQTQDRLLNEYSDTPQAKEVRERLSEEEAQ